MANVKLAHNVTRLAHLELPGAGQVYVEGRYAYVGHLTNKDRLGTTILDVSDPRKPRIVSQIHLDDPNSHSHKARVVGDIMIVNSEQNGSRLGRKSEILSTTRAALTQSLGAPRPHAEIAEKLRLNAADIPAWRRPSATPTTRAASGSTTSRTGRSRSSSRSRRPAARASIATTWTLPTPTSRPRCPATSVRCWSSTTSATR
jgi:hypothetical protein